MLALGGSMFNTPLDSGSMKSHISDMEYIISLTILTKRSMDSGYLSYCIGSAFSPGAYGAELLIHDQ